MKTSIGGLKRLPCNVCGKYGHRRASYKIDGSLPEHVKSYFTPAEFDMFLKHKNGENDVHFELDSK